MKQVRIGLAGLYNTRIDTTSTATSSGYVGIGVVGLMVVGKTTSASTKDRKYQNCFPHMIDGEAWLLKRPGFGTANTPASGNIGTEIMIWTGQGTGQKVITAYGGTNSTIYDGTTSLGAITGKATGIKETFISSEAALLISSTDNTAWYTTSTAVTAAVTFTGDTHTNTTIDNISSTSGLLVGQIITGTGIQANTRIASIDSGTAITTSIATTATNSGVTITRTILAKITDTDFPGNASYTLVGTFAHMDGFACIMTTDGKLWASDLNTLSAWTANSYDSANAYPDKGTGCVRFKNFIITYGTESMQFWYNAGLTPFPFAKSISQTQKVGALPGVADTIVSISDTVFWIGTLPQGGLSIYQFDGSISRISNPELDNTLLLVGPNNISLTTKREYGLSFVIVNCNLTTFVYCIEDKTWHEQTSLTRLWYKVAGLTIGTTIVNYSISNTSTSGKVYVTNPANFVYTDDGYAYKAVFQTERRDEGTNRRKFCSRVDLICDKEANTSELTLMYSNDDYENFTTWGTLDLSSDSPKATRLGSYRHRVWRGEHSANTPFRVKALEVQLEVGQ